LNVDYEEKDIISEENKINFKNQKLIYEVSNSPQKMSKELNNLIHFIENPNSSRNFDNEIKNSRFEEIIDQQVELINNKPIKQNKKINIYVRKSQNFDSYGDGSQNNSDSNEESSRNSIEKNKEIPNSNTIKTINSNISGKERIFWHKEKFVEVRERIKIAKSLILQKEINDFSEIFYWIDSDQNDKFLY